MPRIRKTTAAFLLLGIALLASGCVYVRLLNLKSQIARLHENFRIDTQDGLAIDFLRPVLLEDDLRAIGLPPSEIAGEPERQLWTYVFKKRYPKGARESGVFDIVLTATFDKGRLARISAGEGYFRYLPKAFPIELFQSMGQASVQIRKRRVLATPSQTSWVADRKPSFTGIDEQSIAAVLGQPWDRVLEDEQIVARYRYRLTPVETKQADGKAASERRYTITFVFDRSGALEAIHGTLPSTGKITFR